MENQLMQAALSQDSTKFADLVDSEYRTVNEDGSAMNAREVLAEMRGPSPLKNAALPQPSEWLVRRMGNTALVTARAKFVLNGKEVADLRYPEVWVNRDGKWKFAHWQATRITPEGLQREARAKQAAAQAK